MSGRLFDLYNRYIDWLNVEVLPRIDYIRLQDSYNTTDKAYAKGILHLMHQKALEVYGRSTFTTEYLQHRCVALPCVFQGADICIGLVSLDSRNKDGLFSFSCFTKYGLLPEPLEMTVELENFYWDHYQDAARFTTMETPYSNRTVPPPVQEILKSFVNYEAELLSHGQRRVLEPEEEYDEEIQ